MDGGYCIGLSTVASKSKVRAKSRMAGHLSSFSYINRCKGRQVLHTHYASIKETNVGEPEPIFPPLDSSRLAPLKPTGRKAGNPGEAIKRIRMCKAENDKREEHDRTFFTLADFLE